MNKFNDILKYVRKTSEKTQAQVAEVLNITTRQYQRYEQGVQEPSIDTLVSIAQYFNVSVDYLLGLTDNKEKH